MRKCSIITYAGRRWFLCRDWQVHVSFMGYGLKGAVRSPLLPGPIDVSINEAHSQALVG